VTKDDRTARGFLVWSGVRSSARDQADDLKSAKGFPKPPTRTGHALFDAPARSLDGVLARRNFARGEKILPALQAAVRLAVARELGQEKTPKILVVADGTRMGMDRLRLLRAYAQIAQIPTLGHLGGQADRDALLHAFAGTGLEPRSVLVKDPGKARKIAQMLRAGEIAVVAPTAKAAQEARARIESHPERLVSRIADGGRTVA
jgi:hypothetical protein